MSFFNQEISLGSLLKRGKAGSEAPRFCGDARADWQRLCVAFLILNLCMIFVSIFVYAKINKGELFLVDKKAEVSQNTFDTFKLEQTISYFGEKQARFKRLQEQGVPTSDPYIPKAPIQK
ncbi:MAG: hypothetical protein AAB767_05195 [Patescibacteria group bacterium]